MNFTRWWIKQGEVNERKRTPASSTASSVPVYNEKLSWGNNGGRIPYTSAVSMCRYPVYMIGLAAESHKVSDSWDCSWDLLIPWHLVTPLLKGGTYDPVAEGQLSDKFHSGHGNVVVCNGRHDLEEAGTEKWWGVCNWTISRVFILLGAVNMIRMELHHKSENRNCAPHTASDWWPPGSLQFFFRE